MLKKIRFILLLCLPVVLLYFSNCTKEKFRTAPLAFSADTLTFDTVFTTLGSTTLSFKIYNHSRNPVNISTIQLMHLSGTQFRINVNGIPDSNGILKNVQIPARDSLYVFVEVTVNPTLQNAPFLIIDNVNFTIGSNTQTVCLQAFGQNAHFFYGTEIKSNTTWVNDKPYVIINNGNIPGILVDCNVTLNINAGCRIYLANNSAIFVEGTLNARATSWRDSIIFQGVRLESYYQDIPGQWFGIVFLRNTPQTGNCQMVSTGNFSHCIINESSYGIYAGASLDSSLADYLTPSENPTVTINNTIVKNVQNNAIYGFNANITANNSLFYTGGDDLIKIGLGGNYKFTNCTMYNIGSAAVSHQQPTLFLSNLVSDGTNTYVADLNSSFTNCVVYGNLTNEISFNPDTPGVFNNSFSNCLLQTPEDSLDLFATDTHNLFNLNPNFNNPAQNDFTPGKTGYLSPLVDYSTFGLSTDLWDNLRPVTIIPNVNPPHPYDIGAIERQTP